MKKFLLPNPTRGQMPKVILTVCKIITTKKLGLMLGRGQNQSSLHPCRVLEHGSFSLSYLYPQHQALPSTCALSMLRSELLRVSTLNTPQLWGTRETHRPYTRNVCTDIMGTSLQNYSSPHSSEKASVYLPWINVCTEFLPLNPSVSSNCWGLDLFSPFTQDEIPPNIYVRMPAWALHTRWYLFSTFLSTGQLGTWNTLPPTSLVSKAEHPGCCDEVGHLITNGCRGLWTVWPGSILQSQSCLQMTAAPADILSQTSWDTLSQSHLAKSLSNSDPQILWVKTFVVLSC